MNDYKVEHIKITAIFALDKRLTKFHGHKICLFLFNHEYAKQSCLDRIILFELFILSHTATNSIRRLKN